MGESFVNLKCHAKQENLSAPEIILMQSILLEQYLQSNINSRALLTESGFTGVKWSQSML